MITKLVEGKAELNKFLTEFQKKHEVDHAELVQVVGYALDEIKNPPVPTGTLTPKGEADLKAEREKHAHLTHARPQPAAVLPNPPPAPKLNLVPTPTK